jgi:bifunctional UDP-N-acetylglucosamine pyrophosphorylase/glucosamine-1-phosphate N-acetyltransferase
MNSDISKVAHPIIDRPILAYVLGACAQVATQTAVVIGAKRESVEPVIDRYAPDSLRVVQHERLGTGHATQLALAALTSRAALNAESSEKSESRASDVALENQVLILAGDTPLIQGQTLAKLIAGHIETKAACTILTAKLADPSGYGRVIRNELGQVSAIVEQKDASADQLTVDEINSGIYLFDLAQLQAQIGLLRNANAQGELYLTDVVGLLVNAGALVNAHLIEDISETLGINDRVQLAQCTDLMRQRINTAHQRAGVTIEDSASTWIGLDVSIDKDVVLKPGVWLSGETKISHASLIGPRTTLIDCQIGAGAKIIESNLTGAIIGAGANVGPFTFIRPGTVLGSGAKAGAYVELKNAQIGDDSKVPHLSYVGDAEIGVGTNIGAATIFVNYDGVAKHKTVVGDHVRIGSDSMLVAPVRIGDGAYTAAGSVITEDVPAGAIAVARAKQRNILGWVLRKRSGTSSATAAIAAGAQGQSEAVDLADTTGTKGEGN